MSPKYTPGIILGVFFLCSGPIAQAVSPLEQLQATHAKDIRALDKAQKGRETVLPELGRLTTNYERDCFGTRAKDVVCRDTASRIKLLQKRSAALSAQITKISGRLNAYLTEYQRVMDELNAEFSRGEDAGRLQEISACLNTLTRWDDGASSLFTRTLTALRRVDRTSYEDQLREIPGFGSGECANDRATRCWSRVYGELFYVTGVGMRISGRCLVRGEGQGWEQFQRDPRDLLAAVEDAGSKVRSCLRGLNRDNAESVSIFMSTRRPVVVCSPTTEATSEDTECAHAARGSPEIILTRPGNCGNLAQTVFHELLHAEGHTDNLATRHHNSEKCRRFDAIYHCSEMCFPSTPRPYWFYTSGCQACVEDDLEESRCGALPDAFDQAYIECGAGG